MNRYVITTVACMAISFVAFASCSDAEGEPMLDNAGVSVLDNPTKTLVAYFSAEGHTKAVAEAICNETGSDIFFIEPAVPYAENTYDVSDKIQNEAYNDLRPAVKTFLTDDQMAKYDTIFVGTPCWWHQPAMVVCTFLEHYDLSDKVVIPFVTFGARTYLNETMQKLYKCTPNSVHIPAELPEDIDPDNIRQPQNDDDGIDMPTSNSVRQWLNRIGYGSAGVAYTSVTVGLPGTASMIYNLQGMRIAETPDRGLYVRDGKLYAVLHQTGLSMKRYIRFAVMASIALSFMGCGCRVDNGSDQNVAQENVMETDRVSKSVLIISSSPRRGGNSETLCEQFRKGAEEAGHHVEMLNLNDFDVRFFDRGEYIRGETDSIDDDAVRIIHKMSEADVIVLSSPVYFYSMTGQMKVLIDRTYNHEKELQNKEFYYIVTATDRDPEALDGTIAGFRGFIRCLYNSVERGIVHGNGARERGAILRHPAMQEAYDLGRGI